MTGTIQNVTQVDLDHPANDLNWILGGIVGCIGVLANGFLIGFISKGIKMRQPFEWFLLNVALTDFTLCFNYLFLQTVFIKLYLNVGCKIAGLIQLGGGLANVAAPSVVAVNRYLWLYKQDKCKTIFTPKKVILICILMWVLTATIALPYFIAGYTGLDKLGLCGVQIFSGELALAFSLTYYPVMFSYYAVSIYCSYKVIKKLKEHKSQTQTTEVHSRVMEESKQIIILVSLLLIVPLMIQIPVIGMKIFQMFIVVDPWFSRLVTSIYVFSPASAPFLTLYSVKSYRQQVTVLFSWNTSPVVQFVQ